LYDIDPARIATSNNNSDPYYSSKGIRSILNGRNEVTNNGSIKKILYLKSLKHKKT
jgi:hypothetical protein